MRRDLRKLAAERFDVLVIGGGVLGAFLAREAALRGLATALVERDDFGGATSWVTQRIVHGGLRYLQHLDVARSRESVREQRTLMRIAPHLVRPLPVVVPCYGHGLRGRAVLRAGTVLARLVTRGCDRPRTPHTDLPPPEVWTRAETIERLPEIPSRGLTGAVVFHDAQVESSERLLLAVLRSAVERGAVAANHCETTGFLREGAAVAGASVRDRLGGERFDVRARVVVNAAGPWSDAVLALPGGPGPVLGLSFARGMNVVVPRLFGGRAVGVESTGGRRDDDVRVPRGGRLLFVTPWLGRSLAGTDFAPAAGPGAPGPGADDVRRFLSELRGACPGLAIEPGDVSLVLSGLVPAGVPARGEVRVSKRPIVRSHAADGAPGLWSAVTVKYTTARGVAAAALDAVAAAHEIGAAGAASTTLPVWGGDAAEAAARRAEWAERLGRTLSAAALDRWSARYGSGLGEVAELAAGGDGRPEDERVLEAELRHAVRREMAASLADAVLRRTGLGVAGHPGRGALARAAGVVAAELGWDAARAAAEVAEVERVYPPAGGLADGASPGSR